jgi:hypothetical protein
MIHPGQVQGAVKHQDSQFIGERMSALGGLNPGAVDGDGDVARKPARQAIGICGRKRQNVGRLVFRAKLPIQAADFCVIRDHAGDRPAARDTPCELVQEVAQLFPLDPPGSMGRRMEQQRYVVG